MSEICFQYFSDIHTECYKGNPKKLRKLLQGLEVQAPYLILAGDIGDPHSLIYKEFLMDIGKLFEAVFIVAGNHEYYSKDKNMFEVRQQIKEVCMQVGNIIFLENETYLIPDTDIRIFGATFWTDIKIDEEKYVKNMIGDYRYIPDFSVEKCRELHKMSCEKLQGSLDEYNDRFIVISHHLPSYSLIDPEYQNSLINSAYASDISISNERIVAWVAGHTHTPIEKEKYHVNPIGYKGENMKRDFNKIFSITA